VISMPGDAHPPCRNLRAASENGPCHKIDIESAGILDKNTREFIRLGFGRVGIRKANSYVPTGG
jgi:hypothetical protein